MAPGSPRNCSPKASKSSARIGRRARQATGDSTNSALAGTRACSLRTLELADPAACRTLVAEVSPQAIFHLAGQSRVADSFRDPLGSIQANGIGTLNLLEAMRRDAPDAHFVLASSAEIFGSPQHAPQDEGTPTHATSPYGLSKLLAHAAMASWRASFGLAASSAILFNHESELRDAAFVTRKISQGVARIMLGLRAGNRARKSRCAPRLRLCPGIRGRPGQHGRRRSG